MIFITALLAAFTGVLMIILTIDTGLGLWGLNSSVSWGFAITNFVYWIGIGHAGTLISAILFLMRQDWRSAFHRSAEAMTVFAIICAAVYPVIHTGRPWFAIYWMFPFPTRNAVWPNFSSPLMWDFFAIITYLLVSIMFWYLGMIPDLAILRGRIFGRVKKKFYRILSLGWLGTKGQWKIYRHSYLLLAGLATPLVVSVHSIVSFDFAVSVVPGWHSTLFPPYFVAGAIFSGCAMVVILAIVSRNYLGLEELITTDHFEKLNKIILAGSLMIAYSYVIELFDAFVYAGGETKLQLMDRMTTAWPLFTLMLVGNILLPQLFWSGKMRRSIPAMLFISIGVNIGMWLERYLIVISSQNRAFMAASWNSYMPTLVEWLILIGSFGIFLSLYIIFLKWIPIVSVYEGLMNK